ncbi:phage tail protein [Periweissella cryptocerci]|uniref:Phage tail protein n=1 Tax=Periweissella cryptocerci TaxID=2506420 RepID=A0A4P6YRT8_9LACO|nr:phage tail tube protein [Periweissella cryptocerci]QBO35378.1 phage tail protein [Periweissella cryptocerci]
MTIESGLLSAQTLLQYSTTESGTYSDLGGVQSVPEIGGAPEKVDVTTLADTQKKYIKGLQDTDNMEFKVVYRGSNFTTAKAMETAASKFWKVLYPDGSFVSFKAGVTVKRDATEVNGALTFTVILTPETDFTYGTTA